MEKNEEEFNIMYNSMCTQDNQTPNGSGPGFGFYIVEWSLAIGKVPGRPIHMRALCYISN